MTNARVKEIVKEVASRLGMSSRVGEVRFEPWRFGLNDNLIATEWDTGDIYFSSFTLDEDVLRGMVAHEMAHLIPEEDVPITVADELRADVWAASHGYRRESILAIETMERLYPESDITDDTHPTWRARLAAVEAVRV